MKKRTRFPPFFKPKNKTFSPVSLAPLSSSGLFPLPASQGAPRSAQASRCGGGGGFAFPPRRGGGARGPCPESGPLVWAGCGSSRQPGRATVRHSAMLAGARLPPPRKPACGFGPPLPGRAPGLFCARLAGSRLALAGAARCGRRGLLRLDSSSGASPAPSPLLKRATPGGRLRPSQEPGVRAGLGWARGPRGLGGLCPRTCSREAGTRRGGCVSGGRAFENRLFLLHPALPAAGRGAMFPGARAGRPRLRQTRASGEWRSLAVGKPGGSPLTLPRSNGGRASCSQVAVGNKLPTCGNSSTCVLLVSPQMGYEEKRPARPWRTGGVGVSTRSPGFSG